jgi:hypothetical protein
MRVEDVRAKGSIGVKKARPFLQSRHVLDNSARLYELKFSTGEVELRRRDWDVFRALQRHGIFAMRVRERRPDKGRRLTAAIGDCDLDGRKPAN